MKYLHLILFILLIGSCKKKTPESCNDGIKNQDEVEIDCGGVCAACNIDYSETGAYGKNILFGHDTLILMEENSSMRAVIPEGSSLKIELTLISGETWFYTNNQNWGISDYSSGKQTFTNLSFGISDLQLHNANKQNVDTILIKYFENGNNETRRKILIRK